MAHNNNVQLKNVATNPLKTSGVPVYRNQPSNLSYNSLYDTGNRTAYQAPLPPPRYPNSYSYSNPYNYNYNYNNYNGYSSSLNRPMYNAYNSYSPYHQNYFGSIANPQIPFESSFIEDAQESSRAAFDSIGSVVNTFGSINTMIESTYYALHSSFNAMLSVMENFSRLKLQFSQVLSAFTLIRTLQWLYRKFLYLIGKRSVDPSTESAWRAAASSLEEALPDSTKKSSWPVMMFILAVYAGPFLLWKFFNLVMQRGNLKDEKIIPNGDTYYAIAKYTYNAQSHEELSFAAGDYLKLAPYEKQADKSWPLASNGKRSGIVPVNYIDIKLNLPQTKCAKQRGNTEWQKGSDELKEPLSKSSEDNVTISSDPQKNDI